MLERGQGQGDGQGTVSRETELRAVCPRWRGSSRWSRKPKLHAGDDKKKRELVEAKNQAEALIHSTQKELTESGWSAAVAAVKDDVEKAIEATKEAVASEDAEKIKSRRWRCAQVAMKIGEPVYAARGAEGEFCKAMPVKRPWRRHDRRCGLRRGQGRQEEGWLIELLLRRPRCRSTPEFEDVSARRRQMRFGPTPHPSLDAGMGLALDPSIPSVPTSFGVHVVVVPRKPTGKVSADKGRCGEARLVHFTKDCHFAPGAVLPSAAHLGSASRAEQINGAWGYPFSAGMLTACTVRRPFTAEAGYR